MQSKEGAAQRVGSMADLVKPEMIESFMCESTEGAIRLWIELMRRQLHHMGFTPALHLPSMSHVSESAGEESDGDYKGSNQGSDEKESDDEDDKTQSFVDAQEVLPVAEVHCLFLPLGFISIYIPCREVPVHPKKWHFCALSLNHSREKLPTWSYSLPRPWLVLQVELCLVTCLLTYIG